MSEWMTGSELEELRGYSKVKELPLLFTVETRLFCHEGVRTAKKMLHKVCHFELLDFFEREWQKKAKPTVNSRGILFFKKEQL
jgi:hypothetical protein